jgi:hypothetical protein
MSNAPISRSPDSLEKSLKGDDSFFTKETGAVGAASGVAAGALAGVLAGPPGVVVGAVIGGVVGALTGKAIGDQRHEEKVEEKIEAREEAAIDQGFMPRDPTVLPHMRVDRTGLPAPVEAPDSGYPVSITPMPESNVGR